MDKQFFIYSVDTKAFYGEKEREINTKKYEVKLKVESYERWGRFILEKNNKLNEDEKIEITYEDFIKKENKKDELSKIKDRKLTIEEEVELKELKDFFKIKKDKKSKKPKEYLTQQELEIKKERENERETKKILKEVRELLKDNKDYQEAKKNHRELNNVLKEEIKKNNHRKLLPQTLNPTNQISLFDNSLSRAMGLKIEDINLEMIIVRVYHYDVLKQLITNGFTLQRKKTINNITLLIDKEPIKYKVFTSSAGQIRTKKVIFIQEDKWKQYEKTLMCGLTIEDINNSKEHGCNINKFLAYLALCNSATDKLENFDINKTIVIDDFETLVEGEVDYIDNKTFEVTRKNMKVPIPHSDGCGWVLPSFSKKNFMIRLPWVKGLVTPVNYIEFCDIYKKDCSEEERYLIKDIYGVVHDLKKEDIQFVFSESQFKMYKYYTSDLNEKGEIIKSGWDKYKEAFIKYNCGANYCNLEPDTNEFRQANFNYQMWQSLIEVEDEEIKEFTDEVDNFISNGYSDRNTMLKLMGVDEDKINKTWLQKCLEIYPEMIQDFHCKEELASCLNSKKKEAKYGKFKIDATYTFLLPDVFAWLQRVFLGIETPEGLLKNGEVCGRLHRDKRKLLVNRSPHLYREHAVRNNIKYGGEYEKWFCTDGIYTSSHDHISKILQFDNDGDKALEVGDERLIKLAERNMEGIVPLYYEMGKAKPMIINEENIYESLTKAFKFNNIGKFSNQLTVMWNNFDEANGDLTTIAQITALNNFTIDGAKTLLVPEVPEEVAEKMKKANGKMPYFFQFAKDKDEENVAEINNSTVNRICRNIENIKVQKYDFSNCGKFNKNMLYSKKPKDVVIIEEIVEKYRELKQSKKNYIFQAKMEGLDKKDIMRSVDIKLRKEFITCCDNNNTTIKDGIDILIKYIYATNKNSKKDFLFNLFGDIIYDNLKNNLKGTTLCEKCGERIVVTNNKIKYCSKCAIIVDREKAKIRKSSK